MKNKLIYLALTLTLLTLAACGGGGSSNGSNPANAVLKISLTGSLPQYSAISGATFTITLPENVTPALTNGIVASDVASNSVTFAGSSISPQVVYTAATVNAHGTLKVILTSSISTGLTQVGEAATITLQLANGAVPSAGSFILSDVSVYDAAVYGAINGMGVTVSGVTLQ